MNRAKKHHQVPQFYLRNFADQKGSIRVYDRLTQQERTQKIREVAVLNNLYTVSGEDGKPSDEAEQAFASFEAIASSHLSDLRANPLQISEETRQIVALHMALQFVRTSNHRRQVEDMRDVMLRLETVANVGGDSPELVESFIESRHPDATEELRSQIHAVAESPETPFTLSNEEWLRTTLPMAPQLLPFLLGRKWSVATCTKRSFVTCDSPVVLLRKPEDLMGVGFATASSILFPLSSYELLMLGEPSEPCGVESFEPSRAFVRQANQAIANAASRQVLYFPHSKFRPMSEMTISNQQRTRWINGHSVEGDSWSFEKISGEWIPSLHRVRSDSRRRR
ncbi:MAG: DUF4238 domain-containing protein [Thermomicrobiales bacterium]|jgi:hypothetical protein|nr:DUF4238 domain-containing protein [Thermomicrobiales bacterium]